MIKRIYCITLNFCLVWIYFHKPSCKANVYAYTTNNAFPVLKTINADHKTLDNTYPIHEAITNGKIKKVVKLIDQLQYDVNTRNTEGVTPLHLAAYQGNVKLMQFLIQKGALLNSIDNDGYTPLYWAILGNNFYAVHLLIRKGADLQLRPKEKIGFLSRAVLTQNIAIIKLLLAKGADPNEQEMHIAYTPMHYAINAMDASQLLNADETTLSGKLMNNKKRLCTKIIALLLDKGGNPDAKNQYGVTPLQLAVKASLTKAVSLMLQKTSDVNLKDNKGYSALHYAALEDNTTVLKQLLKNKNTLINLQTQKGNTPLHLSAQMGYLDLTKLLITHGADVHIKNEEDATPLHMATWGNSPQIIQQLINAGADINVASYLYDTPLHIAVRTESYATLNLLLSNTNLDINAQTKEKKKSPLYIPVKKGNLKMVILLVNHGAKLNLRDYKGNMLLHTASKYGQAAMVNYLLEQNKSLIQEKGFQGNTALHFAVVRGYLTIVQKLCEAGIDINEKNDLGYTAFQLAAAAKQFAIMDYFCQKGMQAHDDQCINGALWKGDTT